MLPPIGAVIAVQWALAVAGHGHFLHHLSRLERGAAALLAAVGLAVLVQTHFAYLLGYVGLAGVTAVWLALSGRRHAAATQGRLLPAPLRGGDGHD
jgi:hypothetical protein